MTKGLTNDSNMLDFFSGFERGPAGTGSRVADHCAVDADGVDQPNRKSSIEAVGGRFRCRFRNAANAIAGHFPESGWCAEPGEFSEDHESSPDRRPGPGKPEQLRQSRTGSLVRIIVTGCLRNPAKRTRARALHDFLFESYLKLSRTVLEAFFKLC